MIKSIFTSLLTAVLLTSSATSLWADNWKTADGKVYQNVQVVGSNPDSVTILHQDGGASVPLANLPADIQKRFNYDPAKVVVRVKESAENARVLQAKADQAAKVQQAAPEAQDTDISEAASPPANEDEGTSTTSVSCRPSPHYSMDDLTASIHSLTHDPSDSTHSSIGALTASIHSLRSDPSDANHHSISEIADSGL